MRSSPFAPLDRLIVHAPDPGRVGFLLSHDVAHRGLHGPGVPENSLAAADAAIDAGLAIECDVHLTRDGSVIVFHDADTARLCGRPGRIDRLDRSSLAGLRLAGGGEIVPTLSQLLARIASRVPLLVEIKTAGPACNAICLAVRRVLEGYRGPIAIMGFNPGVSRWFGHHAPRIVRGLVMTERPGIRDAAWRRLAVRRARPDFIAYDVRALPSPLPAALRRRGLPMLSWTVRTPTERATAAEHADRPILERV